MSQSGRARYYERVERTGCSANLITLNLQQIASSTQHMALQQIVSLNKTNATTDVSTTTTMQRKSCGAVGTDRTTRCACRLCSLLSQNIETYTNYFIWLVNWSEFAIYEDLNAIPIIYEKFQTMEQLSDSWNTMFLAKSVVTMSWKNLINSRHRDK